MVPLNSISLGEMKCMLAIIIQETDLASDK